MEERSSAEILVVEDDPNFQRIVARGLAPLGFKTAVATSAKAAYEMVLARPPRLMVVDEVLDPGPSGLTLLRLIKANPQTKGIRVGILTGIRRSDEDDTEAVREGADFFMLKEPCEWWPRDLAARAARALRQPARRAAYRVLVVEDDPGTQELFAQILSHAGYDVLCACSGLQGLELARRRRPDMVFLDIHLPGIDGFELLKRLRSEELDPHLPIVAMSCNERELSVFRSAAQCLGAMGCFLKSDLQRSLPSVVDDAILRAARLRFGNSHAWLRAGPLEVHEDSRLVLLHGTSVRLGARLYSVLIVLLRHPEGLSAKEICTAIDERLDSHSVKKHIERLRFKLGGHDTILCRAGAYRLAWTSKKAGNSKTCHRLSLTSR